MLQFEKFNALPQEKQNEIINSGMLVFANSGYKKAYISEIAEKADISKSMVFYYFGNKKELYFFLLDLSIREVMGNFKKEEFAKERDFFKRIELAYKVKMEALRNRPYAMQFITSFYFEDDTEIANKKAEYLSSSEELQQKWLFDDLDTSKFKDGVKPDLVLKMMLRWTEGYISELEKVCKVANNVEINKFYDEMMLEFDETFEMMRVNLYKPECL